MNQELFKSVKAVLNIEVISLIIAIILFTLAVLFGIQRLSKWLADKYPRRRVLISGAFPVFRLALWIIVIGFVISVVIRPELKTLLAISATAGVAIGLGAQEVVKNVLAGIFILLDRPFRVGDMIEVDTYYGEVTQIGLRTSRIHTFDDSTVTLPNGLFLNKAVINSNSGELVEQVVIEITLPGNVAVRDVKDLMFEAAVCSPYVCRRKPVVVLLEDRFDHGFLTTFKIKVYVVDVRMERLIASDITERVKEEIIARGILPKEFLSPCGVNRAENSINTVSA
jgi:small-conductance mechanosensitive channel